MPEMISVEPKSIITQPKERVALLIDKSISMDAYFSGKLRIQAAGEAVQAIVANSDPRITYYALFSFDSHTDLWVDYTDEFLIICSSSFLSPSGGTSLGEGISDVLQYKTKPNRIILLTDGECDHHRALQAASLAKEMHVIIDAIAIGEASDEFLRQLAELTGGKFSRAGSPEQLAEMFSKLETRTRFLLEHQQVNL